MKAGFLSILMLLILAATAYAAGDLTVDGSISTGGSMTSTGVINANGGITSSGVINANGGITATGAINANSGITATGVINANGGMTSTGVINANGGITVTGAINANGNINVGAGTAVHFPDGTTLNSAGVNTLTGNGSATLPSGLIIKWGTSPAVGFTPWGYAGCTQAVTATFVVGSMSSPFPNNALWVGVSPDSGSTVTVLWSVSGFDKNGVTATGANLWTGGAATGMTYRYFAIGY